MLVGLQNTKQLCPSVFVDLAVTTSHYWPNKIVA